MKRPAKHVSFFLNSNELFLDEQKNIATAKHMMLIEIEVRMCDLILYR